MWDGLQSPHLGTPNNRGIPPTHFNTESRCRVPCFICVEESDKRARMGAHVHSGAHIATLWAGIIFLRQVDGQNLQRSLLQA
jgi:hypothetical protein